MGTLGPGATLTAGVQDIAALLPLLGTEQCEDNIGSALTKGYLYAAATPLSIFGSLGMARAGMKTFVAACAIRRRKIIGAQILADMGFKPQGKNLSLIMAIESNKDNRYLVERRLGELFEELHIDSSREIKVKYDCARWNMIMMIITAVSCLLSITPYIYINIKGKLTLNQAARWTFPILRALGGFLTATMIQLVIQVRIATLSEKWLDRKRRLKAIDAAGKEKAGDVEKGLGEQETESSEPSLRYLPPEDVPDDGNSFLTWCLLVLLLVGIVSVVVGYVGCFSVVQSAQSFIGPISWLCLEAGLSVIRIILWGHNPLWDDAPGLELELTLEKQAPLPTCMKCGDEISKDKVLPLMRAPAFLKLMTSFVGLIEYFSHPDLTLYYTLTRKSVPTSPKNVPLKNISAALSENLLTVPSNNTPLQESAFIPSSKNISTAPLKDDPTTSPENPTERVLYITIFDHKERTTRVYTRQGSQAKFYSTTSGLVVDLKHDQLETTLGEEIDPSNDPVAMDDDVQSMLAEHYRSIMNGIRSTARETTYYIANKWTIQAKDNIKKAEQGGTESADEPPSKIERRFLELGRLERMRRSLTVTRGKWVEDYMRWLIRDSEHLPHDSIDPSSQAEDNGVRGETSEKGGLQEDAGGNVVETETEQAVLKDKDMTEILLLNERYHAELLLVEEVRRWEEKLLLETRNFLNEFKLDEGDKIQEQKQLVTSWTRNCWRRLDAEIHAMDTRMDAAKKQKDLRGERLQGWEERHKKIRNAWEDVVNDLVRASALPLCSESPPLSTTNHLHQRLQVTDRLETQSVIEDDSAYNRCQQLQKERMMRLKKEGEDAERRLHRGLEWCDQFSSSSELVAWRHSRSVWRLLRHGRLNFNELDLPSHVTHIHCLDFNAREVEWIISKIQDVLGVTSISFIMMNRETVTLPSSIKNNHQLLSVEGSVDMTQEIEAVLHRNRTMSKRTVISPSSLNYISDNCEIMFRSGYRFRHVVTISFFHQ